MAPTPALCALSRCSSEARRTPSFRPMERWENEAMRSSFHPGNAQREGLIRKLVSRTNAASTRRRALKLAGGRV